MRLIIYLIFSLIILSCINSGNGENTIGDNYNSDSLDIGDDYNPDSNVVIDDYFEDPIVKSYTSESDTLVISQDCVIFLWPDSLEVEEMKIQYPDGYAEILDDMIYYASEAAIALDGASIRNFFCDKSVLLLKNDKKDIVLNRKKVEGNMILFRYGKKPIISYAIDFNIDATTKFFAPELIADSVAVE